MVRKERGTQGIFSIRDTKIINKKSLGRSGDKSDRAHIYEWVNDLKHEITGFHSQIAF